MQCPKCQYEPTMREQQDSPEQCPSCGVYYAKVSAPELSATREDGASWVEGLQRKHVEQHVEQTKRQKVVVVDFEMPFLSMVIFMVKWALASIPAMILLFIIFIVFGSFFGGLFGGLGRL